MDKSIDAYAACKDAYVKATVNGGGFEEGMRAAIAAYRDAETERLTAENVRLRENNERIVGDHLRSLAEQISSRKALETEIADLRAQLADAQALRDSLYGDLAELRAKLEAAERDAERYRWLADGRYCLAEHKGVAYMHVNLVPDGEDKESLDAAIDAARGDGR